MCFEQVICKQKGEKMKSNQLKLFVCKRKDIIKNGVDNIKGLIFEDVYNFTDAHETSDLFVKDWIMVDYKHRENVLMTSQDEDKNPEIIKEYFNDYTEVDNYAYPPDWNRTIADIK